MASKSFGIIVFLSLCAGCAATPRGLRDTPVSNATTTEVELERVTKDVQNVHGETPSLPRLRFISLDANSSIPDEVVPAIVDIDTKDGELLVPPHAPDQQPLGGSSIDFHTIDPPPTRISPWARLVSDQSSFYSTESILGMGLLFGVGAAIANTDADAQLQKHFQASVRGATSDDWFELLHANKELGNGVYTLPIMGVAWAAHEVIDGPLAFENDTQRFNSRRQSANTSPFSGPHFTRRVERFATIKIRNRSKNWGTGELQYH